VNPPVHAWATLFLYKIEQTLGRADMRFLERSFQGLLLNFNGERHDEMWNEQNGFFYDLLRLPNGQAMRLHVRSLGGLLPLCASTVFAPRAPEHYPRLMEMIASCANAIPR
jgi:hypothetical protein